MKKTIIRILTVLLTLTLVLILPIATALAIENDTTTNTLALASDSDTTTMQYLDENTDDWLSAYWANNEIPNEVFIRNSLDNAVVVKDDMAILEGVFEEFPIYRIRAFKSPDGVILIATDEEGVVFTNVYENYRKFSREWFTPVHYDNTIKNYVRLHQDQDSAVLFFPEENIVREFVFGQEVDSFAFVPKGKYLETYWSDYLIVSVEDNVIYVESPIFDWMHYEIYNVKHYENLQSTAIKLWILKENDEEYIIWLRVIDQDFGIEEDGTPIKEKVLHVEMEIWPWASKVGARGPSFLYDRQKP